MPSFDFSFRRESKNQELHGENQELREKIEVLEYLVGTDDALTGGNSEDPFSYIEGKEHERSLPTYQMKKKKIQKH